MTPFGATILSSDGPVLSADEKALFGDVNPFGFILFSRHIETPDGVRALCDQMREAVGRECLITVDQEGGRVQRMRGPHWRDWHPPLDQVNTAGPAAARSMYLRARLMADELRAIGIDSNCIPTLDVLTDDTHPFLRNRCYGTNPAEVAHLGRATADGLLAGGVLPVMKHIPGHGRATLDTHKALPRVPGTQSALSETDFAPFRTLNDLGLGMTAHLVFEDIDPQPATQSQAMIDLIRHDIGFDGLLMTDDISMGALSGTLAERSTRALAAGCDVILHCNDTFAERVQVAEAAGGMTQAAQRRAEAAMAQRTTPDEIDISAMEAELEGLLGGAVYV